MSIFKVPMGVLKKLESIRRNFFNGHDGFARKSSWFNWNKALASKKNGGIGVSSFFAINHALLFKWVWRFFSDGSSLWSTFIKALFGFHGAIGLIVKPNRRSIWSDILQAVNSLKDKVRGLVLSNIEDRWSWSLEGSGLFSVKSSRAYIDDLLLPKADAATRWIRILPIKINVFAWKIVTTSRYVVPTSRVNVPAGRYVVPTSRVNVPAGRYVVPTGKDNVIVSTGRTKLIPAGRTILVLSLPEDHMADFPSSRRCKGQSGLLSKPDRFERKAGRKIELIHKDAARIDKKKVKSKSCSDLVTFARECIGKQLDSKAMYSAFKLKELDKSEEPKALLSVDSMLNWSDHEGEDEEKGAAQVYGMIAGDDDDAAGDASGDVSHAAAEFALKGFNLLSIFDTTPEDVEGKPLYDRFVKAVEMHVVPSPITGTFMPPSNKPEFDDT
ncbi:hypothetical protein Tco_0206280 [Tanacetum coccineum]